MTVAPQGAAILTGTHGSFGSHVGWRDVTGDPGPDPHAQASELWQQAVHDLRGKLSVVTAVTALLQKPRSDLRRLELMAVLDRNVAGLRELLNGVADLARLDTQQERPVIRTVDVATALDDMCNNLRVVANSRGLSLEISGPASLVAESDPLMVARIAQNLMLNAIQYTRAAGVVLTYGHCGAGEAGHWYFDVGDAGRELCSGEPIGLIRTAGASAIAASGEGIGLSIVGRLCRLLGGTMEITSAVGAGRVTRIKLPRRYVGALQELMIATVARGGVPAAGLWAPAALQAGQPQQLPLLPAVPAKPARFAACNVSTLPQSRSNHLDLSNAVAPHSVPYSVELKRAP
ncbi:sensor histidine kinase [Roseateles sp. P5_E4]